MTTHTTPLNPGVVLGCPGEPEKWPLDPDKVPINNFDTGVFIDELAEIRCLPGKLEGLDEKEQEDYELNPETQIWKTSDRARPPLECGTYRGTQLALIKTYDLVEKRFTSFMDTANFEPLVPSPLTREQKLKFFAFTDGSDKYPPHLNLAGNVKAANKEQARNHKSTLPQAEIFKKMRLLQLGPLLTSLLPQKVGLTIAQLYMGTPGSGNTLTEVEANNQRGRGKKKDIFDLPNVGDLKDWYSDARFSQQQFTGTNPTTIELVSDGWLQHFIQAASAKEDAAAKETIANLSQNFRESLYMQDYSYFRTAAGLDLTALMRCDDEKHWIRADTKGNRFACASVCLFYLNEEGQLYPLAIVIDWRKTEKSVTIYNRELIKRKDILSGKDKPDTKKYAKDEAHDWAWRYAKTCVQCSDWFRHEVSVHLVNTHLVEEAIIVASHRQLDPDHPVMRLLFPHWQKTLALNAAARTTLVPEVIVKLIGIPRENALKFIRHEYKNFDFKKHYVPTDLKERGFPLDRLNSPKDPNDPYNPKYKKFHNYAYARCIYSMWYKIRNFVKEMLKLDYSGPDADSKVLNDERLQAWSAEIRSPEHADLPSFPIISTFDELVDCATMCIHIASPQHTAVNYLQNYYQSFVVNKPPCLYAEPPTSLGELLGYTEKQLVQALPINHGREWLLSSHIPYLLSFKPGDKESLISYAYSKYNVYKGKTDPRGKRIGQIAKKFYEDLVLSDAEFKAFGQETDDKISIPYEVLSPDWNAVSILI